MARTPETVCPCYLASSIIPFIFDGVLATSKIINGKRPWRKDLYQRYLGVVNTEKPYVNRDVPAWASPGSNIGAGEGI